MVRQEGFNFLLTQHRVLVDYMKKLGDAHEEVVSVDLDKVVPCDRRWIDVMLSKRTNKVSSDEGVDSAPGVRSPVHKSGDEISSEYA